MTTDLPRTSTLYAIVDGTEITAIQSHPTDEAARSWHRSVADDGETLVVLDLGPDQEPRVGDLVTVDEDGVATLAE